MSLPSLKNIKTKQESTSLDKTNKRVREKTVKIVDNLKNNKRSFLLNNNDVDEYKSSKKKKRGK